ncbi:rhodanese-like domain-containing protein [Sphingorhabdus sp. EL138]|uniref:rhodanese-like domain-containing protein n=1 Tax=Sphingorhabdus sp. EL138 TaxID=2073156 RepID=UPI0013A540C1|nr:rhodanese-like domain-containing protein [Sphingorhabdus sp. EL138]
MKISPLLASATILSILAIQPTIAQTGQPAETPRNPQVDYAGFLQLTEQLSEYRTGRLIDLDRFNIVAKQPNAVILDTRSAAAFAQGHIDGAINIPFSDFTEEKLTKILGEKSRPILIYCNNNFRDNVPPIVLKRAPLALNIPTFINLYGYGYENIYELDGVTHIADPRANWTGEPSPFTLDAQSLRSPATLDATRAN